MADKVPALVQRVLSGLCQEPEDFMRQASLEELIPKPYRPIYTYIAEYFTRHGKSPTWTKVRKNFRAKFELKIQKVSKKTASELVEELINAKKAVLVRQVFDALADTGDIESWEDVTPNIVDDLISKMKDCVTTSSVLGTYESDHVVSFGDGSDLKELYANMESGAGAGYQMYFKELSDPFNGLKNGSVYGMFGAPGVKKTFILALQAAYFALSKIPTFLFSSEMSSEELKQRVAAMLAGVSYDGVIKGTLSKSEKATYYAWLDSDERKDLDEYLIFGGPTSCPNLVALEKIVREHRIHMICLDTIANMADTDQNGEIGWMQIQKLMRELNILVKRHQIPCLYTSHFNRSGSRNRSGVAHGDAFFKYSAQAWSISSKEETSVDFCTFKTRESSDTGKRYLRYKFDLLKAEFRFFSTVDKSRKSAASATISGYAGR